MFRWLPISLFVIGYLTCLAATALTMSCFRHEGGEPLWTAAGGVLGLGVAAGLCFLSAAFADRFASSSSAWVVSGTVCIALSAYHAVHNASQPESRYLATDQLDSSPFVDGCASLGFGVAGGLSALAAAIVTRRHAEGGRSLRVWLVFVGVSVLVAVVWLTAHDVQSFSHRDSTFHRTYQARVPPVDPFDRMRWFLVTGAAISAGGMCLLAAGVSVSAFTHRPKLVATKTQAEASSSSG